MTGMASGWFVRPARVEDSTAISRVIVQALEQTNSKDYSPVIITRVIDNFSPERVVEHISNRQVFVAMQQEVVVGTASLDGDIVRSVFVLPNLQNCGIGQALLDYMEGVARASGISRLAVPASVGAEGFYRRLGYVAIRDEYYEDERTILMEKAL